MKTKIIEGWVHENHLVWIEKECSTPFHPSKNKPTGGPSLKAKLIIEIPEKKIEITESEFKDAFFAGSEIYSNSWAIEIERAWKKLFNAASN